ncbi:hypothetical protein GW17_00062471 [Ensete ventricosum]|nr:hypothetical protein GW17_00062471 [Ensete ventricosum]
MTIAHHVNTRSQAPVDESQLDNAIRLYEPATWTSQGIPRPTLSMEHVPNGLSVPTSSSGLLILTSSSGLSVSTISNGLSISTISNGLSVPTSSRPAPVGFQSQPASTSFQPPPSPMGFMLGNLSGSITCVAKIKTKIGFPRRSNRRAKDWGYEKNVKIDKIAVCERLILPREIIYPCIPDPDGEDKGGQASSSLAVSTQWIYAAKLLQSDLVTLAQREGGE